MKVDPMGAAANQTVHEKQMVRRDIKTVLKIEYAQEYPLKCAKMATQAFQQGIF